MRADRRVDTAGNAKLARADGLVVKRLAHAVESLEFVIGPFAGDRPNCRQRMRIVRGKHSKEGLGLRQQRARASKEGDIRRRLAREYRISVQALLLRALDLTVPISAFDKSRWDAPLLEPRDFSQLIDHRRCALAIGLHREPQSFPALKVAMSAGSLKHVDLQIEPVRFFSI